MTRQTTVELEVSNFPEKCVLDEGIKEFMNKWLVLRTKPSSERKVSDAIRIHGYSVYCPFMIVPRPPAGYMKSAMFPGYLFVKSGEDVLPAIGNMPGVLGWLMFDGLIASVTDDVISEINRRVDSINREGSYPAPYSVGQEVLVKSGVIESLAEIVGGVKPQQSRVKVILEFAGNLVPATVPWRNISPVGGKVRTRPLRRTRGRGRWIRGFGPNVSA